MATGQWAPPKATKPLPRPRAKPPPSPPSWCRPPLRFRRPHALFHGVHNQRISRVVRAARRTMFAALLAKPLSRPPPLPPLRRPFATATDAGPAAYARPVALMHWLSGLAMVGCIASVLQAQQQKPNSPAKGEWMFRHKSLGLLAGLLVGPRVALRLAAPGPGPLPGAAAWEALAAKASHAALYAFLTVMPATGIAMGYYGGKGLPFFWTTLPGAAEANGGVAKRAFSVHKTVGTYGKFLVPVHVGAAGFHAVKGQAIFRRISPF